MSESLKKLRVGIIGFGMIGKVHAFCYSALPFYCRPLPIPFELTRICTGHQETAETACQLLNVPFATTDYREITENPDIDAVHICSPNGEHFPALLSAIQNNKHIYCDKPMVAHLSEALQIEEELNRTDVLGKPLYTATSQMTFHLRFFPALIRARQIIQTGRLGRIFQYRVHYLHSSNTKAESPFRWKNGREGGAVRDLVSHLTDLIDSLIGLPDAVFADSETAFAFRNETSNASISGEKQMVARKVLAEDSVCILTRSFRKSEGQIEKTTGIIEASKLATGFEDDMRLEIHGEKGALRFSLLNPHFLEFFDVSASDRPYGGESGWLKIQSGGRFEAPDTDFPSAKSSVGWTRAHIASLSNFLQAIAKSEPGCPNLRQGIRVQKFLDTVFQSLQREQWTFFNESGAKSDE